MSGCDDVINPKEAIDFLKQYVAGWDPSWFIQLVAIEPVDTDRKAKTAAMSVALDDINSLVVFIIKWKHWGIYFGVNPLIKPLGVKARKNHIAALAYYHLDFDPPKQVMTVDELAAWKVQARQVIVDKGLPAPSALVDSGNGLGSFWKLAEPVLHDGGKEAEALEVVNRALIEAVGGDKGTCNLDRVMRLPGTINHPNLSKKKLQRTKVPTALLAQTDEVHKKEAFHSLPRPAATSKHGTGVTQAAGDLPARFVELLAGDEDLRKRWDGDTDNLKDPSRNGLDMSLTSLLVRRGFNDAEIAAIHRAFPHGKVVQDGRGDDYIRPMLDKCRAQRILSRTDPLTSARRMVAERFTSVDGVSLLRHWNGDSYIWSGGAYRRLAKEDVDAKVQNYLEGARHYINTKKNEAYKPTPAKVANVRGTLEAAFHLDSQHAMPCWLDGASGADPRDLLVVANGMLHMPTRALQAHDPRLFTTTALPFAYAPDADPPRAWLAFLRSVWGDDHESIELLQEFFGYSLSPDCSRQKILLVVGPKRSGKGTIARVLRAVIGEANCAGPTLASLANNFGLQPLIGKRVAIISDARLGNRTDKHALTERLCSISGEDVLTIDRKNTAAWTGALGVRLIMFTNELPKIVDDSNALSSRFLVLRMTRSFFGMEDLGLADRLLEELPAILNWSLDGLERLKKRGAFRQPDSAMELVQELEDLTSPVGAFIRDCCVVAPSEVVETGHLYSLWEIWRRQHGWNFTDTKEAFGASLRAAVPGLEKVQTRAGGDRRRIYKGIGIATGTSTLEDLQRGTSSGTAAIADLDAARAKKRALLL